MRLTVADLAEAAGVTPRTIRRLEIGGVIPIAPKKRHGHVNRDAWDRIVDALERGMAWSWCPRVKIKVRAFVGECHVPRENEQSPGAISTVLQVGSHLESC